MLKINKTKMLKLTDQDYSVFAKKIGLSVEKTKLLLEEEKDLNLVLQNIYKTFSGTELLELSLTAAAHICLMNSTDGSFTVKEKEYIATIIGDTVLKFKKKKNQKPIISYANDESAAKHNIISCAFFNHEYTSPHITTIEKGLEKTPLKDHAKQAVKVIDFFKKISKQINLKN